MENLKYLRWQSQLFVGLGIGTVGLGIATNDFGGNEISTAKTPNPLFTMAFVRQNLPCG